MNLLSFIFRSLIVSFQVMLRMAIILAGFGFCLFLFIALFKSQPVAILIILGLLFFPLMIFLYLSCIRAALISVKASGPPNVKKLINGTYRLFRFNMMINNLVMTLVGIGGSVAFMAILTPELWTAFRADFSFSSLARAQTAFELMGKVPVGVFLLWVLGICISAGIIGTSSGAVAASCAEDGPTHDLIWGATRQFGPLFLLSALVLFPPVIYLVVFAGGPKAALFNLSTLNIGVIAALILYFIWAGCAISAGKALAYLRTVEDMEAEWKAREQEMLGEAVPQENLRELRLARQEAQKLKNPDNEV